MSNGAAPTCPISYSQPTQPTPQIKATTAAIPRAHNLITVILAINRMNNVIQNITRGAPQINNTRNISGGGENAQTSPVDGRQPFPGYAGGTWQETNRNYNSTKLVNPDTPSQSISIKTIGSITFTESETGNTLVYTGQ